MTRVELVAGADQRAPSRFVKADPNARKQAIEVDGKLAWGKDKKAN